MAEDNTAKKLIKETQYQTVFDNKTKNITIRFAPEILLETSEILAESNRRDSDKSRVKPLRRKDER